MDSILLQKKVTENVQQMQDFMKDLGSWEKEMKRKEQQLLQEKYKIEELPPVRKKICKKEIKIIEEQAETCTIDEEEMTEKQKREKSLREKESGNELVKQGKWKEAIDHYTQAIECYANDATFYANRAFCYLNTKQWKEAETDCTIALQIDSNYVKVLHRRALALKELNQLSGAQVDLQKALNLDPNNTRLKADYTKVEKLLSDQLVSNSKNAPSKESNKATAYSLKETGNTFVQKKNWKDAIESYTSACRFYPEDSSFYSNRALCYLKLNEPKKAILDCIRALELDPKNIKALYRKALANESLGDYARAHDDLLTAFKIDPSNKSIHKKLDKVEKHLGISEIPKQDVQSKGDTVKKRITGEKFIELGGEFIKPIKKPAHLLSKDSLKKVEIFEKSEKSILQNAIDEINQNSFSKINEKPVVKIIPIQVENPQIDINLLPIPRTSLQFLTNWNKLVSSPILQYQYLKKINGRSLPSIFKDALETDLFSQILEILRLQFIKANEPVHEYLYGLSNVKRFSALLLFASKEDRENINFLINHCKTSGLVDKDISELKTRFCAEI